MADGYEYEDQFGDEEEEKTLGSGFVEINPDLAKWMAENKSMGFSGPADPYIHQFGPGKVVSGQELKNQGYTDAVLNASYFQPDSGDTSKVKNVLPEYDPVTLGNYAWMIPLAVVGAGLAAGAMAGASGATASVGAADAAGLATMAGDAGIAAGAATDAFVASGGTMGSTAAGGGGVGFGAVTNVPGSAGEIIGGTTSTSTGTSPGAMLNEGAGAFDAGGLGGGAPGAGGPTGWTPTGGFPGITDAAVSTAAGSPTADSWLSDIMKAIRGEGSIANSLITQAGGMIRQAFAPSPEEQYNAMYAARTASEIAIKDWVMQNSSLVGLGINVKPTGKFLPRPASISGSQGILRNAMR